MKLIHDFRDAFFEENLKFDHRYHLVRDGTK